MYHQSRKHRRRHRRQDVLEAKREIMNDSFEHETEFGPNDQDKEMLVTSAA